MRLLGNGCVGVCVFGATDSEAKVTRLPLVERKRVENQSSDK